MTPQPWSWLILAASMDSVMEPIWFTFRSSALHAFFSIAAATRFGFVTSVRFRYEIRRGQRAEFVPFSSNKGSKSNDPIIA